MYRRRWLQFSLRGFFIILTVGCIWTGWLFERARRQRAACNTVDKLGGSTYFEWQVSPIYGLLSPDEPKRPIPDWLYRIFGDDVFFNVSLVRCGRQFADANIPVIEHFDTDAIVALRLDSNSVSNAGLEALPSLPSLKALVLESTQITDKGLSTLGKFPRLQYVVIKDTRIGDRGLDYLTNCKRLKAVSITGSTLSQSSIEAFCEALPDCQLDVSKGHQKPFVTFGPLRANTREQGHQ